jgi:hypothetical protein
VSGALDAAPGQAIVLSVVPDVSGWRVERVPKLVDPDLRTVEVFETMGGRATRVAGAHDENRTELAPFESEAPIAQWWPAG